MKILHTNFLQGWGGQSNRIFNVCRGLAQRGHEVVIAAPANSELVKRARAAGLPTDGSMKFRRGLRPVTVMRDIRRMRGLLREGRFDILHTHGSQDSWVAAFANRPKRLPVVRTKHNIFPLAEHFPNRWLYGKAFDRIICISDAILAQCASKPFIPRDRLVLIHSAVDLEHYAQPDPAGVAAWRAQWGDHHPIVAIVGRLREEKGHRFLFEATARLRRQFPAVLLIVAGDGSLRGELEQLATTLGIADRVRFLGFRTDVPEILAATDLFVMPSLCEGLGTAAIEASAAGRPIVASRVGGVSDVVHDGDTGRLVEPADPDDLARVMAEVLADRNQAERLGQAARRYAFDHFRVDSLVEKNLAVYCDILGTMEGVAKSDVTDRLA